MCSGISSAHSRHLDDWYRAMYERSVVIVQQAAQRSVRCDSERNASYGHIDECVITDHLARIKS